MYFFLYYLGSALIRVNIEQKHLERAFDRHKQTHTKVRIKPSIHLTCVTLDCSTKLKLLAQKVLKAKYRPLLL